MQKSIRYYNLIWREGVILFDSSKARCDVTLSGIMPTGSTRMEEAVAEGGPDQQVAFEDL